MEIMSLLIWWPQLSWESGGIFLPSLTAQELFDFFVYQNLLFDSTEILTHAKNFYHQDSKLYQARRLNLDCALF